MKTILAYILAVVVVLGLIAWLGLTTLDRMVTAAADQARSERDAHWTAEIAESNAETERALRLQAMAAQAADAVARDAIEAAHLRIMDLEKANAALPDNACGGLGRDRVKLLDFGPR